MVDIDDISQILLHVDSNDQNYNDFEIYTNNSTIIEHKSNEGSGSDDDDSDDDEDDEDDENPPYFKYKRITELPPRFLNNDQISTCYSNSEFLIFATHSGILYICDTHFKPIKLFKAHTSSIFSIDYDGEYFATCSMDGTVLIGLFKGENNELTINDSDLIKFNFKRPIYSISLHKPYSKTKGFFTGGTSGDLIYSTKNWLNQRTDTIIDSNNGYITMIESLNDLLVYSNNNGISMYQISLKLKLLNLPVPKTIKDPELYWPKLQFIDDNNGILIGWLNYIYNLKIGISNSKSKIISNDLLSSATSTFTSNFATDVINIEIIYEKKIPDIMISGISEFNNLLIILNYLPKVGKIYLPPELKILDNFSFDELSIEGLLIKNYQGLNLNDYQLIEQSSSDENKWLLISPNDLIVIEPYNINDKINWFIENGNYFKAWEISKEFLTFEKRLEIGENHLNQLINSNYWIDAMEFLPKMLAKDNVETHDHIDLIIEKWNSWLDFMYHKRILTLYYNILPTTIFNSDKQIDSQYYEIILHDLLRQKEFTIFLQLIKLWNHSLFDLRDIQLHLNEIIDNEDEGLDYLRRCYIDLSLELDEPNNCINQMIILNDDKLMEFLNTYHLINSNLSLLPKIILIGTKSDDNSGNITDIKPDSRLYQNIQILIRNLNEIVPKGIVEIFKKSGLDIINFIYLKEIEKNDNLLIKDFEDEMILLFAKFSTNDDDEELYKFLKNHKNYSIDKAIEICQHFEHYKELVYLLNKIGDYKNAIKLIVDQLKDPKMAINFVSNLNDQELWDFLLDYSMNKSEFIKELLINIGILINPIPVISRIPLGVEISNLQEILININKNISLDLEIYNLINEIISNEFINKNEILNNNRMKGTLIDDDELKLIAIDNEINNLDCTYLKIIENDNEKLVKEEELIGEKWNGDKNNKIAHKSYLKYKLL